MKSDQLELRSRGLSYQEIAHELQVSKASITSDIAFLREQVKGTIKEYVTEQLPEQYQVCLCVLDTILKYSFNILETSDDNREKLQAMELFKDTHLVNLELLSNATTIDNPLHYIRNKQPTPLFFEILFLERQYKIVCDSQNLLHCIP